MKKLLVILTIIVLFVGGCTMLNKPRITKEQQDNIARRILRSYNIESIEFTNFKRDGKTGYYLLSIKINNDEEKETTLSISDFEVFNEKNGTMGLNPIDRFKEYERPQDLDDSVLIDLTNTRIKYLGE